MPRGNVIACGSPWVHADQRDPCRKTQSLGRGDTDQQGPDQTRAVCDGDSVHILQLPVRLIQRLTDDLRDSLRMFARGDLRHNTPIKCVDVDLGGNHIGENLPAVDNDRGSSLIAAGFNCKDRNFFF